jgi:hypothetical protein
LAILKVTYSFFVVYLFFKLLSFDVKFHIVLLVLANLPFIFNLILPCLFFLAYLTPRGNLVKTSVVEVVFFVGFDSVTMRAFFIH